MILSLHLRGGSLSDAINFYIFLIRTSIILLTSVWGVRRSSCYATWIAMELNLVLFIPMIINANFKGVKFSGVKYLVIQRVSGIIILVIFIVASFTIIKNFWLLFLNMFILLKLGAAPFFQWVLIVGENQGWWRLYLILTLQKVVPLYIVQLLGSKVLIILRTISFFILPLFMLRVKSIKKIVIISSTYLLIAIISATILMGYKWKSFIALYSVSLFPLIRINGSFGGSLIRPKLQEDKTTTVVWLLLFVGLIGVPPFPGFLLKFDIRLTLIFFDLWVVGLVFNLISGILMYIYINIIILKVTFTSHIFLPAVTNSTTLKLIAVIVRLTWILF